MRFLDEILDGMRSAQEWAFNSGHDELMANLQLNIDHANRLRATLSDEKGAVRYPLDAIQLTYLANAERAMQTCLATLQNNVLQTAKEVAIYRQTND